MFKDFKDKWPDGTVLSRDTGYNRNYNVYPYGDYETSPDPLFPMESVDTTVHPKTIVYGIEVNGKYKAYPKEKLSRQGMIRDKIGDVGVDISYNDGDVTVTRLDINEEIPATRLFWFAWKAFRPKTQLY